MLKPDDPVFACLLDDLRQETSRRYVKIPDEEAKDPRRIWDFEVGRDGSGVEFRSLSRDDQRAVLCDMICWGWYHDNGLIDTQGVAVINNVVDGKPQERWLEGVFESAVVSKPLQDILREDHPAEPEPTRTQDRGMEM